MSPPPRSKTPAIRNRPSFSISSANGPAAFRRSLTRDVLDNPRVVLGKVCDAVGVPFTDSMLAWPPGLRDTDGVWAKYWYKEVETTTAFRPYKPKSEEIPAHLSRLLHSCREFYDHLYFHRLKA